MERAMNEKKHSLPSRQYERRDTFFRLINPEDYYQYGINPRDVPMGTFAAEDHPGFLPSRFGGNAYGLGLIEQAVLNAADMDFLESLDFQDTQGLGDHAGKLNAIYQKLGLLIRFSLTGKPYFLIPINLVAHSLQEIKNKADEIEELIVRHVFETRTDRLDIGLLTSSHDLIVHELTARLSSQRIFLFESLEKLRSWRTPLDIVILPKDPFEYLLEQKLPRTSRRGMNRRRLMDYAMYLLGKVYDLIDEGGKIHVLAHSSCPQEDESCRVRFKSEEELKFFLLFSHTFKTRRRYEGHSTDMALEVHLSDLHYYLNRFAFFEPQLKRLLNHHKPEELTIDQINRLPHLNLRLPKPYIKNHEKQWKMIFEPYFEAESLQRKSPKGLHHYWKERLEIDREMPESLLTFVGKPRKPCVTLADLEEEIKTSGMQGCSLPLVAEYRKTFRYVIDVLKTLVRIRDHKYEKLSELELTRLTNPFRSQNERFSAVVKLLSHIPKLERIRDTLNPDEIEGPVTPILENIPKLALHGFTPAQLREILLIVVGHTTMSRIVFGKLPAKTLKPITDRAKSGRHQESLDLLRACRLMSMAEIIVSLGDSFAGEQARELYRIYDDAINVATEPNLDWDKLNDLRISALGGVQNRAIREMMKIFNLFEFLDEWQEYLRKGPSQKEVICDYNFDELFKMEEALQLARIADEFKQRFMGDYVFGQSYFFRQFLDTEFHGTGHLFRELGTRAGFVLLWIAVNSSERNIINFNPILAGIPRDRREPRIRKIEEILLRIPVERLQPAFFDEIKKTLAANRPAFIFDSGIRLISHPVTRVIDISFVDVDENIQQIEALLAHFESQKLRGISLKNLQEMERRFSELESFHEYLDREGCFLQCGIYERVGGVEEKDREIVEIEQRLKRIIQSQIFVPEEIYDTISVLAQHCPEILRFILPEFHALGNLVENWPTRKSQSMGAYVMRCLEKFQALVIKDRNAFQDRNTFYQLAKQEFGALAEEGIGATHSQLETLEFWVERIQEKPVLYQALTLALLFQEIGKLEPYSAALFDEGIRWTHAEEGALILEKSAILDKYGLDHQVEQLVVLLVKHHGLIGHVIQGEEPIVALEKLTSEQDSRLLDVFVLHSILSASAVEEGLMISDLLDAFLKIRSISLEIIKSKSNWETGLRDYFRDKGAAVLTDLQLDTHSIWTPPSEQALQCGFVDADIEDEALWHGRQSAAVERLLKLVGATWVDYQDLQMHLLRMPVHFIYHKKKLKSVGLATFEKQLQTAVQLIQAVSGLDAEVRYYLLYCLDHLGGRMRIYDFHPLTRFLGMEECLKLLIAAFQAFHHHFGLSAREGLISFRLLSRDIQRRHEVLRSILRGMSMPRSCFENGSLLYVAGELGDLRFEASAHEQAVRINYQDAIQFDILTRSLTVLWEHGELNERYDEVVRELQQKLPYDTKSFREELQRVYEEQQRKINDRVLKSFQEKLSRSGSFEEFRNIRREIEETQSAMSFSEEQQFLLEEVLEFHLSRLREIYLDNIFREINKHQTRESLSAYWNNIKYELFSLRSSVGKEYESLIARFVDERLNEMDE